MITPILDAKLQFNQFLNNKQKLAFEYLDDHIQTLVMTRLQFSSTENLDKIRLSLDIVATCLDTQLQGKLDSFLSRVLDLSENHIDLMNTLAKIKKICNLAGGAKAFFGCASTKKTDYYTIGILKEISDQFYLYITSDIKAIPSEFSHLPFYDEGGKEALYSLKNPKTTVKKANACSIKNVPSVTFKELLNKKNSFLQLCNEASNYLQSLPDANRLSMEDYAELFRLLKDEKKLNCLSDYVKSSLIKLCLVASSSSTQPMPSYYTFLDLAELVDQAFQVHENCGEEVLIAFSQGICNQDSTSIEIATQALKFLDSLSENYETFNDVSLCLQNFQKNYISLKEFMFALEKMVPQITAIPDDLVDIEILMHRFSKKDFTNVMFPIDKPKRLRLKNQFLIVESYCKKWKACSIAELVSIALEIQKKSAQNEEDMLQLVAIGRLSIWIKFYPIYLHPMQILTVLGLLLHEKGALAQVKTGEGKSFIVALLSFVLVMQNKNIHNISSSTSLAMRDQAKMQCFFKTFNVTSAHICEVDRKSENFDAQMLYGVASDYEFAIMAEMLYFSKIFLRPFDNTFAIVDEVDNLTIDTALNGARYGYPAEIIYDWIYHPIFKFVQQNILEHQKYKIGLVDTISELKDCLKAEREGKFKALVDAIGENKLKKWLSSAYNALYKLKEKDDYIVRKEIKKEILIVDQENTGKIMEGMRWSGGTHEFIEIKHQIEVKTETITPISMQHAIFYQYYPLFYGLTGTLGAKSEREEINEIYGVDTFDVPTNKPSLRIDKPPVILKNNMAHSQAIVDSIMTYHSQGRPLLVLCKTIQETEEIEKILKNLAIPHELLNEMQPKSEEEILENAGLPGAITIATNNAGRGTDIKLKKDSLAKGGLHVIITFFPSSLRIEGQARGRAGRQGEPGSSEIILSAEVLGLQHIPNLDQANVQKNLIDQLENDRDENGKRIRHLHVCKAQLERFCFKFVKQFYQKLKEFVALSEDERILREFARNFGNRILNKTSDLSSLAAKDRQIAEEMVRLLQQPEHRLNEWKLLLQQAIKRIKDKIINDWALLFLSQVEDIMADSTFFNFGLAKDRLDQISKQAQKCNINEDSLAVNLFLMEQRKQVRLDLQEELESLKLKIQNTYQDLMKNWDERMNLNGSGIIDYLSSLLGVELILIKKNSIQLSEI